MDELKAVWAATADGSNHSAIIRLLALTGARAREIGELEWVKSANPLRPAGTAPRAMKNNRAHTIYLTQTMRGLIDSRRRGPDQARAFIKMAPPGFLGENAQGVPRQTHCGMWHRHAALATPPTYEEDVRPWLG